MFVRVNYLNTSQGIHSFFNYFQTDMNDDMKAEVLEMCVNACEKHTTNNENAAKMIKETVTKDFLVPLAIIN